ncbi:helicase [Glaciihabitans arcticus]|uniref:Helicase n=1 Tax=Glaciihabitans arcticus TaxID=2668039 RepID=A0A4Q9GSD0_9MICO|nr:ATP-binding domain-containing protein [Glaciihabitans arcticus]TBN56007.1 helicase [Glaciihabitans arcticus]
MSVNVVEGAVSKPVATGELVRILRNQAEISGEMTTGFPVVAGDSHAFAIDSLLVSPLFGVVAFDVVEGNELGDFETRQDDLVRVLKSRLSGHRELNSRRDFIPHISAVTFAPGISDDLAARLSTADYPVLNGDGVLATLSALPTDASQTAIFEVLLSAVQNLLPMRRARVPRSPSNATSRGARLLELESSIATLDGLQSRAVIEPIDGVQRIRGLAGSGKTVVLAMKAAYLHTQHPEWKIAVTFNTRSLKDQFRRLISGFSFEATGEEPDWKQLRILNAWGGIGKDPERGGIYSEFCAMSGANYFNFSEAANHWGSSNAFAGACNAALKQTVEIEETYDAILVDEAQDLPASFLKMCHLMLKEPKRLVYAYDELQNLNGGGLPSPEEVFGSDRLGRPLVEFESPEGSKRDVVLEKCYRNSRPVLVTAHALGFGIYRQSPPGQETGLVQLFEHASLWEDIGYDVDQGPLEENREVVLSRTERSSPPLLERHSPIDDLIQFHRFDSKEDQNAWVAAQIESNIREDELRHDDIIVINPNGITARKNLAPLRADLLERGISNHLAGIDTSADVFFDREGKSVTFTGIYRAKGNEAGMVYIVNAEEGVEAIYNLSSIRNRLFTAITRSKAWVRVVGVGDEMDLLVAEFERAKAENFKLHFRYPTATEREKLTMLHRDVSPELAETIRLRKKSARDLLDDLEEQRMFPEDLDPEVRARLIERLLSSDGS